MEDFKISKENLIKVKDGILFILLFLWMAMPIFQTLRGIYEIIDLVECYFELMKIIGVVGITSAAIMIPIKIKNSKNKKQTLKELIPIFLFILYMIWTLISCLSASNTRITFKGSRYRREGYYMYLNYAGYFLSAFLIDSKRLKKVLLNTFIIASIFLIIISRITLSGTRYVETFVNSSIETTVFAQFNHYCYYLMMTLMCALGLFLTEKNKVLKTLYLIAYIVIAYAMIYNDTFGCYLATAITLIFYCLYSLIKKKNRRLMAIAIIIFSVLSIFTTKDGRYIAYENLENFMGDINAVFAKFGMSTEETSENEKAEIINDFLVAGTKRGELWEYAYKFILKNPIIGYGADNLGEQYDTVLLYGKDRPHNLVLYLACVSGIPGMLIYLLAVGIIIIKGIIRLIKGKDDVTIFLLVVIAYMISSMFGNSMFYTSPFFFIFLGFLYNNNLEKYEK